MVRRIGLVALTLVVIAAACDLSGRPGGAPGLLPDVPNTDRIEGQQIVDYVSSLAEGGSLLTGNPVLAAGIAFVQRGLNCYQDIGAVAVRAYVDKSFALSTGVVAIVDRAALTDPGNFVKCMSGGQQGIGPQATLTVCTKSYTLNKDDTEYDIAYIGTTQEMCDAFCSRLEGCGAQP